MDQYLSDNRDKITKIMPQAGKSCDDLIFQRARNLIRLYFVITNEWPSWPGSKKLLTILLPFQVFRIKR